jgi:hypothetical protein
MAHLKVSLASGEGAQHLNELVMPFLAVLGSDVLCAGTCR